MNCQLSRPCPERLRYHWRSLPSFGVSQLEPMTFGTASPPRAPVAITGIGSGEVNPHAPWLMNGQQPILFPNLLHGSIHENLPGWKSMIQEVRIHWMIICRLNTINLQLGGYTAQSWQVMGWIIVYCLSHFHWYFSGPKYLGGDLEDTYIASQSWRWGVTSKSVDRLSEVCR